MAEAFAETCKVANRSWSYYAPSYVRVLRTFRNGPAIILSHHRRGDCPDAVFWNGSSISGPAGRAGFAETVVEIWGMESYTVGFYEPRDGDTILDLGANVGLFSLWIARRAPRARVFAFEPFRENFSVLKRNVEELANSVFPYQVACGAGPGWGMMRDGGPRSLDHQLEVTSDASPDGAVRVISLADAVTLAGDSPIDLLKIDIEGSEYDIFAEPLPLSLLRRFRRIAIEYHDNQRPGTRALIQGRLSGSHVIHSVEDSGQGYGILRAALKS